jgi:hypothetical protein
VAELFSGAGAAPSRAAMSEPLRSAARGAE